MISFIFVLGALASASAGLLPYSSAPVTSTFVLPRGHGIEGQFIPDHIDKLYDDGLYKPELRRVPLSPSPLGLVPAGSGLEGQYVRNINDKFFDDGLYKHELRGTPLAPSPFGLVPAGSGIEGSYVRDINDKLFDDGLYRRRLLL